MNKRSLILLNFLSVYFIWGSTYILMKVAAKELHPFAVIFWQNLTAIIILSVFNYKKNIVGYIKSNLKDILSQSFLMLISGVGFITISVSKVSPALASIIISTVPLWIALFDMVETKKAQLNKILGVILGFIGIVLLTSSSYSKSDSFSVVLLIIASASWSIGLFRARKLSNLTDPYLTSIGQLFFAGIFYFIYFAFKFPVSDIVPHQMPTILSVFSLGVLGDAIAFTSFIWLLNNVTPVLVSTYAYVNPVVSIVLSWFFFGEKFGIDKLFIIGVILLSIYITALERKEKVVYG